MKWIQGRMFRIGALSLIVFLAICAALLDYSVFRGDTPCEVMQNWKAANAGNLPKTYNEICAFPLKMRPIIFSALTPVEKVAFQVAHKREYLERHPHLTEKRGGPSKSILKI